MWRKITIVLAIIVADQLTKFLVTKNLVEYQSLHIIGNFLQFTLLYNKNGVFGLNFSIPYIPFVIIAIILIVFMLKKIDIKYHLPLLLILSGAFGNLIDRIRVKAVIDFIDFGIGNARFYVFNVADSSISIGIALWLLISFKENLDSKKAAKNSVAQNNLK
ncbi:MAG: signal peptidase II [bacterium]|nr:signal peptidase II [bacterium]